MYNLLKVIKKHRLSKLYGGNKIIVGRKKEIELLKRIYCDNTSHFVAIYGRHRIGKTYLINEVYKNDILFRHSGVANGNLKEQLFAFDASLKNSNYQSREKIVN